MKKEKKGKEERDTRKTRKRERREQKTEEEVSGRERRAGKRKERILLVESTSKNFTNITPYFSAQPLVDGDVIS